MLLHNLSSRQWIHNYRPPLSTGHLIVRLTLCVDHPDILLNCLNYKPINLQAGLLQSITSIYSHGEKYCHANSGKPGDGSFHECIHVKPMGPITLPLDELAITRLKLSGKQLAPQVWEFKGTNISFSKHRQWGKFREGFLRNALQDLYPYESKPTFQLQRLLLCGPGSWSVEFSQSSLCHAECMLNVQS